MICYLITMLYKIIDNNLFANILLVPTDTRREYMKIQSYKYYLYILRARTYTKFEKLLDRIDIHKHTVNKCHEQFRISKKFLFVQYKGTSFDKN